MTRRSDQINRLEAAAARIEAATVRMEAALAALTTEIRGTRELARQTNGTTGEMHRLTVQQAASGLGPLDRDLITARLDLLIRALVPDAEATIAAAAIPQTAAGGGGATGETAPAARRTQRLRTPRAPK